MELFFYLLTPLGLTILIESVIAFVYHIRSIKDFSVIFFTQILTNPLINLFALFCFSFNDAYLYGLFLFIGESLILITEALIYKIFIQNKKVNPFYLASLCNLFSFGIGIIYCLIDELVIKLFPFK